MQKPQWVQVRSTFSEAAMSGLARCSAEKSVRTAQASLTIRPRFRIRRGSKLSRIRAESAANAGGSGSNTGHATLVRGSAALRQAVPVFEPEPPALAALSARIRESFDPRRILNRGRMVREA